MEFTKSVRFIASLHFSLRNTCMLNVLLLQLFILLVVLLFLHTSNICCCISSVCFCRSVLLLTTSIIKFVNKFTSGVSLIMIFSSFLIVFSLLQLFFRICFHNPQFVLYNLPHLHSYFFAEFSISKYCKSDLHLCLRVFICLIQSFFLLQLMLQNSHLYLC